MGSRSHPVVNSPQPEEGNSSIEGVEMEAPEDGLLWDYQLSCIDSGINEKEGRVYEEVAVLYVTAPPIIGPSLANYKTCKPHVRKVRTMVFDLQKR